jgi:uncharacterized Zn-finger protein
MLDCPYCGKEVEDNSDSKEQDTPHEAECPHCNMSFVYYIEYYPSYTSVKAPCLNGGKHDYKPICGIPEEYFRNKRRCSYCENEIEI